MARILKLFPNIPAHRIAERIYTVTIIKLFLVRGCGCSAHMKKSKYCCKAKNMFFSCYQISCVIFFL